ncbi:hypothetical protein HDU86_007629 [Geranomyces michiganensis]|nr:hypothetical protein HDU86_007629 [Geranomyces michiganensis]
MPGPTTRRNGTIFWTGTRLSENVLYFVHVAAIMAGDGTLQTLRSTSRGFRVYSQRPVTGYDYFPGRVSYVQTSDQPMNINCTAEAANGGLDIINQKAYLWADPHAAALLLEQESFVRTTKKIAVSSMILKPENDGKALVTACNATMSSLSLSSLPSYNLIVHDGTPPLDATNLSCTQWISRAGNSGTCTWQSARDDESGIASYTLNVGTTGGGSEIASYPDFIGDSFTLDVPSNVINGTPFLFVSVIALNRVGLSTTTTTHSMVAWTPPGIGPQEVHILQPAGMLNLGAAARAGLKIAATCQTARNEVRATWTNSFTETSSEIVGYDIALSTSTPASLMGDVNHVVVPWLWVGNVTSYTLRFDPPVPVDTNIFVSVRALDAAGLSTVRSSAKVGVVAGYGVPGSGPRALLAIQQLNTQSTAQKFAIKSNFLRSSWKFAHICPIVKYQWKVVDITESVPITIHGPIFTNLTSGIALNLNLEPNRTYATAVRAFNSIGISSYELTSAGTSIIWAPAAPKRVFDGPIRGVQTEVFDPQSMTELSASWESFSTSSCEVHGYQWAVGSGTGSAAEQTSVLPFTDAGSELYGRFPLTDNLTLYTDFFTTVRAVSCTDDVLYAFSSGFHVGVRESPSAGQVWLVGARSTFSGVVATADRTQVVIGWSGFHSIWSPRLDLEVALGTSPDPRGPFVTAFTAVNATFGSEGRFSFTNLALNGSTDYYTHVRATDASLQTAQNVSAPFVVDLTPPRIAAVRLQNEAVDDVTWQTSTQNVTFSVDGILDQESSISDFAYTVLPVPKSGSVSADDPTWISLGSLSVLINNNGSLLSARNLVAYVDLAAK